jgi:hypothetical protein
LSDSRLPGERPTCLPVSRKPEDGGQQQETAAAQSRPLQQLNEVFNDNVGAVRQQRIGPPKPIHTHDISELASAPGRDAG